MTFDPAGMPVSQPDQTAIDKLQATVDLLNRTGLQKLVIGWHEEHEGPPVYFALGMWTGNRNEVAAALDPLQATMRLCERVIDGGQCRHCHESTIFYADDDHPDPGVVLETMGCVYAYDPELKTFRRGCEGE